MVLDLVFFSMKPRDWLRKTSSKWNNLFCVWWDMITYTQSVSHWVRVYWNESWNGAVNNVRMRNINIYFMTQVMTLDTHLERKMIF